MKTSKLRSDDQIEHNIAQVDATFSMEGMPLTDEDKKVFRQLAKGELSMEDILRMSRDRKDLQ